MFSYGNFYAGISSPELVKLAIIDSVECQRGLNESAIGTEFMLEDELMCAKKTKTSEACLVSIYQV